MDPYSSYENSDSRGGYPGKRGGRGGRGNYGGRGGRGGSGSENGSKGGYGGNSGYGSGGGHAGRRGGRGGYSGRGGYDKGSDGRDDRDDRENEESLRNSWQRSSYNSGYQGGGQQNGGHGQGQRGGHGQGQRGWHGYEKRGGGRGGRDDRDDRNSRGGRGSRPSNNGPAKPFDYESEFKRSMGLFPEVEEESKNEREKGFTMKKVPNRKEGPRTTTKPPCIPPEQQDYAPEPICQAAHEPEPKPDRKPGPKPEEEKSGARIDQPSTAEIAKSIEDIYAKPPRVRQQREEVKQEPADSSKPVKAQRPPAAAEEKKPKIARKQEEDVDMTPSDETPQAPEPVTKSRPAKKAPEASHKQDEIMTQMMKGLSLEPEPKKQAAPTPKPALLTKPKASSVASSQLAIAKGANKFITNSFSLEVSKKDCFYQYALRTYKIIKEDGTETEVLSKPSDTDFHQYRPRDIAMAINSVQEEFKAQVGQLYSIRGFNLWTRSPLEKTVRIRSEIKSTSQVVIEVDKDTERVVSSQVEEGNQCLTQLINILLQQNLVDLGYAQLAKRSKYFDLNREHPIRGIKGVVAWDGFKVTASPYSEGFNLVIDNCSRFLTTDSVYDQIQDIWYSTTDEGVFRNRCLERWQHKSIIANYATKRTYIVHDILFTANAYTEIMLKPDGSKMTIAQYLKEKYDIDVIRPAKNKAPNPLLRLGTDERAPLIPAQLCLVDGVPESIRSQPQQMRKLLGEVRNNPGQKVNTIQDFVNRISTKMKKLETWGLSLNSKPIHLQQRQLKKPVSIKDEELSDESLRKMKVEADGLKNREIIFISDLQNQEARSKIIRALISSQRNVGVRIEENNITELTIRGRPSSKSLTAVIKDYDEDIEYLASSSIVVMVIREEAYYAPLKHALNAMGFISQMVRTSMVRNKNEASIAGNILKQMSAKCKGESLRLKLPLSMRRDVMVIGIDVCHEGKQSTAGFCASVDPYLNHYYSRIVMQKKNQELVMKELEVCFEQALLAYENRRKSTPKHIIIFRDGVGEGMRDTIIKQEISQIKQIFREKLNKAIAPPQITLIIVNKRISQRIFAVDEKTGAYSNPASGAIVNSGLVEKKEDDSSFDFYLVPQKATQGCVTPTHFFVCLNESSKIFSKADIENLTYGLCFTYTNWAGAIKSPAPCQYAHKLAEYHYILQKTDKAFKSNGFSFDFNNLHYFL